MKVRRKQTETEAHRIPTLEDENQTLGLDGVKETYEAIAEWCGGISYFEVEDPDYKGVALMTPDHELVLAAPGSWIVHIPQRNGYFVLDNVMFNTVYEAVSEPTNN